MREFESQETEMKINSLLVEDLVIRTDQSWRGLLQTFLLALFVLC